MWQLDSIATGRYKETEEKNWIDWVHHLLQKEEILLWKWQPFLKLTKIVLNGLQQNTILWQKRDH
jgi:hypothetical protein